MCDAVGAVRTIDPAACRARVEERFSVGQMADGYVALYERLLDRPRRRSSIDMGVRQPSEPGDADKSLAVA